MVDGPRSTKENSWPVGKHTEKPMNSNQSSERYMILDWLRGPVKNKSLLSRCLRLYNWTDRNFDPCSVLGAMCWEGYLHAMLMWHGASLRSLLKDPVIFISKCQVVGKEQSILIYKFLSDLASVWIHDLPHMVQGLYKLSYSNGVCVWSMCQCFQIIVAIKAAPGTRVETKINFAC